MTLCLASLPSGTHNLHSHEDHDAHEDEEDGSVDPHVVEEDRGVACHGTKQ